MKNQKDCRCCKKMPSGWCTLYVNKINKIWNIINTKQCMSKPLIANDVSYSANDNRSRCQNPFPFPMVHWGQFSKNSFDFHEIITHQSVTSGVVMVSFGVVALFTNIPANLFHEAIDQMMGGYCVTYKTTNCSTHWFDNLNLLFYVQQPHLSSNHRFSHGQRLPTVLSFNDLN